MAAGKGGQSGVGRDTRRSALGALSHGDDKRRVLDATDIVRLVGDHVALKPKGREFIGLCPFHNDHAPSMYVVPSKQIYHCFSCGAGGNAIDFTMNYHKMPFLEALEYLAQRAGVTLTPRRPERPVARDERGGVIGRAELLESNARASVFFRTILGHAEHGRAARELIARRGISAEMVESFGLGASPDRWDGLSSTIAAKSWSAEAFVQAGLLKPRATGGYFDMFRNRLMFPIHDQAGRVIAFGARRINDEEEPKYLNSPESPVFNKSSTLYGLHQAARAIHSTRTAIVTEGYMDTIACHQAGVTNAVATLGTALTEGNARILRRLCDTVYLLFDGDAAGIKAAERAVAVFFAEPVDVRIAVLSSVTDAKDPDELLKRENGRAILDSVLAKALDPLELMFQGVRSRIGSGGMAARARVVEEFIATLADLGISRLDPMRRQLVNKRLAAIAGVDQATIASMVSARAARRRVGEQPAQSDEAGSGRGAEREPDAPPVGPRRLGAREHLLGCVLCEPTLLMALDVEHAEALDPERFAEEAFREVAKVVHELFVNEESAALGNVLTAIDDSSVCAAAVAAARAVESITDGRSERLHEHWNERLRAVLREDLRTGVLSDGGPDAEPDADDSAGADEDWQKTIHRLRRHAATLGPDPTALPRPSG
ncbi:MAG: DNA primase [Phycisphaeraceae bacterium]|nr:DNA primase [Phycisphaeraceae bacterium]